MVDDLEVLEEELKNCLMPFICMMFSKFHEERHLWLGTLSIISELDCLASLAITSGSAEGPMCRPEFVDEMNVLELKAMRHPTVATGAAAKNFIPNNTVLSNEERVALVTGPNMGGKSTLLR